MSSSLTDEEIARRLPPGQHAAKEKFPVLDLGIRPEIPEEDWRLRIGGLVENAVSLSLKEIRELPHEDATTDFHCVTTWSVLDAAWGGVPFSAILDLVIPHAEAHFVFLTSYDGYTTNVPVEALHGTGVLLADRLDGQPLPVRHGGPLRVVIPQLYGWKSAKFIKTIEFRAEDEPGYWEKRGYSDTADPWKEERFREA